MPYIFVDDGSPEAGDVAANYVWYEADDAESMSRAQEDALRRLAQRRRPAPIDRPPVRRSGREDPVVAGPFGGRQSGPAISSSSAW